MTRYATPASDRGAVLGRTGVVDVGALSPQAKRFTRTVPIADFTQDTTTKKSLGPLGVRCKLVGAFQSFRTVPAGGTLSTQVVAYDASGNAEVNLTDTLDPEAATAREGQQFDLATTNPDVLEADDTIEIHSVADDNAVGTQQVDGYVTLVFEPVEDDPIDLDATV